MWGLELMSGSWDVTIGVEAVNFFIEKFNEKIK
jgi:hypothetical protein